MAEKQPRAFQAAEAARQLESRKRRVDVAIGEATRSGKKKKPKPPARKKGPTTYEEAKRTKHVGSEGEVAYGQRPTPRPKKPKRKGRFAMKGRYPK